MIKIKVNLNVYLDKFIHVSIKQYSAFRTNFRRKIYVRRENFRRDVSTNFCRDTGRVKLNVCVVFNSFCCDTCGPP